MRRCCNLACSILFLDGALGFFSNPAFCTYKRCTLLARASSPDPAAIEPLTPDGISLEDVYRRLKLEVLSVDDGTVGIESRDPLFGIEIVKVELPRKPGLGLELIELARGDDGRGLVLVSGLSGNAADSGLISIGDTLTWVGKEPRNMQRVEGQDFDETVAALSSYSDEDTITLVLKRLVKRAALNVVFETPAAFSADSGCAEQWQQQSVTILAGSNLRSEMMRRSIPVYDDRTKRFDQPYATGSCAGEGICGTCFVEVKQGAELLSPPDNLERMMMRNLPARWRLSCRTVVGGENTTGDVVLRSIPQSAYVAEKRRDTSGS